MQIVNQYFAAGKVVGQRFGKMIRYSSSSQKDNDLK